jgi:hypothetical protein
MEDSGNGIAAAMYEQRRIITVAAFKIATNI